MNNIKKIGLLLLVLGMITGSAHPAKAEKPDATLRLSGGSLAAGIGFSWGKGTLTYKGKDYPVSVNGLSLGKVGITGASAQGEVYNLKHLLQPEAPSRFQRSLSRGWRGEAGGVTLASRRSGTAMTNQAGVTVLLSATQRGVDVNNLTGAGVDMQIKK